MTTFFQSLKILDLIQYIISPFSTADSLYVLYTTTFVRPKLK
jgi:hypothetical protein